MSFFIDEEDGLLDTEVSKEEVRKRLKNNDGILSGFLSNAKFDVEAATYIKRYHKDKSKMEKVEAAYYYLRYKHIKAMKSLFSYASAYNNYDVDQLIYVDDVLFSNTMAKVLDRLDIEYNYVAAVERDYGSFSDIVSPHELTVGLKVDDQYIFAFSQYSNFNRIPEDIRGSEAILYKNLPSRYKEATISDDVIPESNYKNNLSRTEQQVSFDEELELITMNETNTMNGYQRDGHISFILKGSDYDTKDARRYNPRYAPPAKKTPRGNKVRIAEQLRKEKAEAEEAKKERYEKLKKYHNAEDYELDEYISFELLSDGRFTDSTALKFKEKYTLKGFINKAGRNYSFNVGHLIGGQFQLDEEDMERIADIHMYHGKGYVYDITVEIPEGYTVEGLDQLSYKVDNSMGAFIASAKLEGNKLIIKTEKYYKTPHADKSEWPKMIEFLEAAYEFSQKKVILKKRLIDIHSFQPFRQNNCPYKKVRIVT